MFMKYERLPTAPHYGYSPDLNSFNDRNVWRQPLLGVRQSLNDNSCRINYDTHSIGSSGLCCNDSSRRIRAWHFLGMASHPNTQHRAKCSSDAHRNAPWNTSEAIPRL